jgi:DNA-binding winged helix-turn-helix (wHTH) protein
MRSISIAGNCVGEPRSLPRAAVFDVLAYLISHRGRVISSNDLIASVWSGRIVSASTLSSRIATVRHAIGDSGERRLIRTIPRKGYRFIAQVRESSEARDGPDATPKNAAGPTAGISSAHPKQAVTFCRTVDGIKLAVANGAALTEAVKRAARREKIRRMYNPPLVVRKESPTPSSIAAV